MKEFFNRLPDWADFDWRACALALLTLVPFSNAGKLAGMIRNIIFDWSGTLVDDLPAVWRATNYILAQAKREPMTLEKFRAEFCLPFKKFYDRHLPEIPMAQLEVWFHHSFREGQDSVLPLPHAREFLEFCRARGLRLFLLSTVHQNHYDVQARATGFGEFLERAYLGVMDKQKMIRQILTENHLPPGETIFIGDMQHDIETAHHGGIGSCAVLTGYNTVAQLRTSRPDLIVEHLGELRIILERNDLHLNPPAATGREARMPVATVGALICDEAGRVLMVRTHKWADLWGIPGGKIKWGEDSFTALRREIKEETNLEIDDIRFVLVQDCIHSQEFYRDAHFVLLNYTARCVGSTEVRLNEEAREFVWVAATEALKMPINQPTRVLIEAVRASDRAGE